MEATNKGAMCPTCGKRPPAPGRRQCRECLDRASGYRHARAAAYAAAGLCSQCGKCPPIPGRKYCEACRNRSMSAKRRTEEARKAAGLCTHCGKRPPAPGRAKCPECLERLRAYWAHSGACDGDCDSCKYPDCVSKGPMLDRYRERRRRIREERRAAGLCTQCGAPADPGHALCGSCRQKARERERGRKRKR